jgi:raffinose/stachyose/melibiose transport system substrate-binding protein
MDDREKRPWGAYLGFGLVVISYIAALTNVFRTGQEQTWTNKKVIRICHWQLETGFREAFDWVIGEYEKIHPDVKVIQLAIPDKAYQQYIVTQFVGRTAPDIIEAGQLANSSEATNSTIARYFYGLSELVYQPNPYNDGNELKGVPWIHTFKHDLEWNWDAANLDYYTIGITGISRRLVYNKTLLKKITGRDVPPSNFRAFLDMCKQVKKYSDSTGQQVYALAAAKYQYEDIVEKLRTSLTVPHGRDTIDRNMDAQGDPGIEPFFGWLEGRFKLDDDRARISNEPARELLPYVEPGFMAKDRQDAAFSFSQKKALMILTASWDMNSMVVQARASGFELGVMEFPIPDGNDPKYGKYAEGVSGEYKDFNMPFGVCKLSRHADVAIDFLRFYSSKEIAEGFCERCGWMCAIRGTKDVDFIEGFEPTYVGYSFLGNPWIIGNETYTLKEQLKWDFYMGKISFDEFVKRYVNQLIPLGAKDLNYNTALYKNGLVPSGQALSSLALRLRYAADEKERDHLRFRLTNAAESYASYWTNLQTTVYQLLMIMNIDNERTRALKKELQYRMFIDQFVNAQEKPRGPNP